MQHAPRDQAGETPAPMPVHRPIATTSYVPGEKVKDIKAFQFLDDGKFVKVYLPLDNLDRITPANITADFETRSLCITIRGLEQLPLQFRVAHLQNEVSPDECQLKILKTKVMLKLKKAAVVQSPVGETDQSDPAIADEPDLAKEPSQGAEQDEAWVQETSDNAPIPQPDTSQAHEHFPHWHQLRK